MTENLSWMWALLLPLICVLIGAIWYGIIMNKADKKRKQEYDRWAKKWVDKEEDSNSGLDSW